MDEIEFREAISYGTKALMLDPYRAETSVIFGTAWHRLGQKSRAVEYYQDALAQDAQMRSAGRHDLAISDRLRNQLESLVGEDD